MAKEINMLATGSKVIVIASSLKKSTGPRVGSLGYTITPTLGMFDSSMEMYYGQVDILFTRYNLFFEWL